MVNTISKKSLDWVAGCVIVTVFLIFISCDFEVTNPGPVQDDFLDDPGAHSAIIQGAKYSIMTAHWMSSYFSEESVLMINRNGRIFCCPKVPPVLGRLVWDDAYIWYPWREAHQARFVAVDAFERFSRVIGEDEVWEYENAAWAKFLAGISYKLLGENMCEAVIDGSEAMPNSVYWERAEDSFQDAIQIAQDVGNSEIEMAATAAMAVVLGPGLGRWTEAVQYSQQIPDDFVYQVEHSSDEPSQYNHMWYLGAGDPWEDWTVYGTFFEDYYLDTGDPRTTWVDHETDDTPMGLPWYEQQKYTSASDNVDMISGREMRFIEAEAELRAGNWQGAMNIINDLRTSIVSETTDEQLEERTAENEVEAWAHLYEERRVEFWLEGKRMFDLRRWIDDNLPVEFEDVSHLERLCLPIPRQEREANPNIPMGHQDPVNPLFGG